MRELAFELLRDDPEAIEFTCGHIDFQDADGRWLIQKDYRVRGDVWQVHKTDVDPFPSRPHAHCVDGRHEGMKMHLGTAAIYDRAKATGLFYPQKHFLRLCELIGPKFPGLVLPLEP